MNHAPSDGFFGTALFDWACGLDTLGARTVKAAEDRLGPAECLRLRVTVLCAVLEVHFHRGRSAPELEA
jgi:hypothetical protein